MKRALIIEDDPKLAELVSIHLGDLKFQTVTFADGRRGLDYACSEPCDLIILDLMLPSLDGIEICRKIRSKEMDVPIIMLTAKSEEIDKVLGLETGADDYMTKPFSVRELQARVKALMRRTQGAESKQIKSSKQLVLDNLTLDLEKRVVRRNGERLDLTPKEFDLLAILATNPGKSFNRKELLNLVWGYDFIGFEHTVNSHINRLRSKVEEDMSQPKYILTTWGYGYRFNEKIV